MRQKIITTVLSILLLVFAVFIARKLMGSKKTNKPTFSKVVTSVYTSNVKNGMIPLQITTSGNLTAKKKINLFSEVQGVFEKGAKDFKEGTYYPKGSTILRLNSQEFRANLQAQKSSFQKLLVDMMPDLQLDFPDVADKWQNYLDAIDINKPLAKLPAFSSEKEKYFISARNIIPSYYNINNLQIRLEKYTIRAPFSGILTEANVTEGTLVSPGQNLGEFILPNVYELEVAINVDYANLLKVGKSVELHDLNRTNKYLGKVVRVNGKIDQATQTVNVYVELKSKELKEGMFLEADVDARNEENAFEISRKLLLENNKVFVVKDTVLTVKAVSPIFYKDQTVIVRGLDDGDRILAKVVPGAYNGMKVEVLTENN